MKIFLILSFFSVLDEIAERLVIYFFYFLFFHLVLYKGNTITGLKFVEDCYYCKVVNVLKGERLESESSVHA